MKKYGSHFLFGFQVIAHIAIIMGAFTFSLNEWLLVFFVYFLTGSLGISITYHRFLSHNSFKNFRFFEVIGTILASYGLVGSSIAWVNNHRAHHRFADTDKDPHSPQHLGYGYVQWMSMFASSKSLRYISKLRKDSFHIFMHRYYFQMHGVLLITLLATMGWHTTAVIYLAPAALLWNCGSLINTICHSSFGYTTYPVDSSKNNSFLGIFMWGEGYHNNHHAHPNNAQYGRKWWEIDISWLIIKLIRKKAR